MEKFREMPYEKTVNVPYDLLVEASWPAVESFHLIGNDIEITRKYSHGP